ncbi:MAG: hypothetical protein JKY45_06340 [Emcibacter sp.]|nr:hypothetical protein [Emcibacter sp.]
MTYTFIENILVFGGLTLMVISMVKYYQRTKDSKLFKKIWFSKLDLTKQEYLFNRIGLYILILGIIVRFMNNLML